MAAVPEKKTIPVWAAVAAGGLCACLPLLIMGRGHLWPPETPAQPAGVDLAMMLGYARAWLETGNPFLGLNPYPPVAAVGFAPLAAFLDEVGLMGRVGRRRWRRTGFLPR